MNLLEGTCIAVVFCLLGVVIGIKLQQERGAHVDLRNHCEATLPRDQHCVLQFVPAPKE